MQQWKKRVKLMELIYSALIQEIPQEQFVQFYEENETDLDIAFFDVISYLQKHLNEIINLFKPLIASTWTWERISYVDKAVLICAYAEYYVLKTPKSVVIDQALITARNYGIGESYKFINPILEKVLH